MIPAQLVNGPMDGGIINVEAGMCEITVNFTQQWIDADPSKNSEKVIFKQGKYYLTDDVDIAGRMIFRWDYKEGMDK